MNRFSMLVVALGLMSMASTAWAEYQTDKRGAMVVTKARLSEEDQGEILGELWDSVVFSRKVTQKDQGLMIISKRNLSGSWVATKVTGDSTHWFGEPGRRAFMDRLGELVGPENLGKRLSYFDTMKELTQFELSSPLSWFLIDQDRNATQSDLPSGSVPVDDQIENLITNSGPGNGAGPGASVEESVLVEIGHIEDIQKKYDLYQDSRGAEIYSAHFERIPLRFEVFESRPGILENDERIVGRLSGFDARFHRRERSGALVIPTGDGQIAQATLCNVKEKGDGAYTLSFNADALLSELILPNMEPVGELRYAVPADGREHVTDFRMDEKDPCGPAVIKAELRGEKAVQLILEPASGDPTIQYRVQISAMD